MPPENVSAGANVGERLMAVGWRHYGRIRGSATQWLDRVEIDTGRIDDPQHPYAQLLVSSVLQP